MSRAQKLAATVRNTVYTAGPTCADDGLSALAELERLAAAAERYASLLLAFEQIPVRRKTQTTVVLDRRELDEWRQRCGTLIGEASS